MGLTQCAELKFAENKQTISGCKNSLKNQEWGEDQSSSAQPACGHREGDPGNKVDGAPQTSGQGWCSQNISFGEGKAAAEEKGSGEPPCPCTRPDHGAPVTFIHCLLWMEPCSHGSSPHQPAHTDCSRQEVGLHPPWSPRCNPGVQPSSPASLPKSRPDTTQDARAGNVS